MSLSGKSANLTFATLVPFLYNIYRVRVKLATFKISHLNSLAKVAKISADEYFLCVGYIHLMDCSGWIPISLYPTFKKASDYNDNGASCYLLFRFNIPGLLARGVTPMLAV